MNETLKKFFDLNEELIKQNFKIYMNALSTYRENIKYVYFDDKTNILSYEFTFKIYNNINLSKEELKALFVKEKNPKIKNIGEGMDSNKKINFLYDNMNSMNKSMIQCWWILLWHDLWNLNKFFKGYAKPNKTTSTFNVYQSDNIALNYELYKDRKELEKLITKENKWKYFKKRKLFESIWTMLDKIKSREEIEKRYNTLSPEERQLLDVDDDLLPSSYFGSPKSSKKKSLHTFFANKKNKEQLELQSTTSPFNKISDLKTEVIHVQSAEMRSPTEVEHFIDKKDDYLADIENLVDKKDVLDELVEEEKKNEDF